MTGNDSPGSAYRPPAASLEVDAALGARWRGLPVANLCTLVRQNRVSVPCGRGTAEDAGLYRAMFYFEQRRAQLVLDDAGQRVGRDG